MLGQYHQQLGFASQPSALLNKQMDSSADGVILCTKCYDSPKILAHIPLQSIHNRSEC